MKYIQKKIETENTRKLLLQASVILHITGARESELRNMKEQDAWTAIATGNLTISNPKNNEFRVVHLHKKERSLLSQVFGDKVDIRESTFMFSKELATILSAIIRKTLGSKYSIHSYRFGYSLNMKDNKDIAVKITLLVHDKEITIEPDPMEQKQMLQVLTLSRHTPMKVLKQLVKSEDKNIKRWLGSNERLHLKQLIKLLRDDDPYVKYGVLSNPKIEQRIQEEKAGNKKRKILDVLTEKNLEIIRDVKEEREK